MKISSEKKSLINFFHQQKKQRFLGKFLAKLHVFFWFSIHKFHWNVMSKIYSLHQLFITFSMIIQLAIYFNVIFIILVFLLSPLVNYPNKERNKASISTSQKKRRKIHIFAYLAYHHRSRRRYWITYCVKIAKKKKHLEWKQQKKRRNFLAFHGYFYPSGQYENEINFFSLAIIKSNIIIIDWLILFRKIQFCSFTII